MQISESELRALVREILSENVAGGAVYTDAAGYGFAVRNNQLVVTKRPKNHPNGQTGLPIVVPQQKIARAVANLRKRYPKDQSLANLVSSAVPAASQQPAAPSGGLVLGRKTGKEYPVTVQEIMSNGGNFVHTKPAGVPDCSAWAKRFVGRQGNAWIANKDGTIKFDTFTSNFSSYKQSAEALFTEMNKVKGLNDQKTKSYNPRVQAMVEPVLPSPMSLARSMQIGDIVGMYFKGSSHHAEAFYESCSGYSLTRDDQDAAPSVTTTDGMPWDDSMLGKDLKFVITKPFAMNTHLGFVGGMLNGEPILYHNMNGSVHVNRLSTISRIGVYPVWIEQGNYDTPTAKPGMAPATTPAAQPSIVDRIKNLF